MTGSILKSFVEQMKWVQPDHKYSHVRPEDLQLYASKASFLQKWREWTIKTSVICSHISLIAKSIMPGRNLFLWSWKFRKKMVLELKTSVFKATSNEGRPRQCLPVRARRSFQCGPQNEKHDAPLLDLLRCRHSQPPFSHRDAERTEDLTRDRLSLRMDESNADSRLPEE